MRISEPQSGTPKVSVKPLLHLERFLCKQRNCSLSNPQQSSSSLWLWVQQQGSWSSCWNETKRINKVFCLQAWVLRVFLHGPQIKWRSHCISSRTQWHPPHSCYAGTTYVLICQCARNLQRGKKKAYKLHMQPISNPILLVHLGSCGTS